MNSTPFPLRLGTRGSPLALVQAHMAAGAIAAAHGLPEGAIAIVPVKTSGDRIQDRPLAEIGGKALWTKELDRALAAGEVDFCVHSMKDVETVRPAEILLAAFLPRADVRDRLIGAPAVDALPEGARIGTSSPRRAAQLLALRPDLAIGLLRGNVATRLAAVEDGRFDATLLAAAGLDRLGHGDLGAPVPVETLLPAAQQGAIGIETLAGNARVRELLAAIDDAPTRACVSAERALLLALGADCRSPVAALARQQGDVMTLTAQILAENGGESLIESAEIRPGAGDEAMLADALLARASPALRALFAG